MNKENKIEELEIPQKIGGGLVLLILLKINEIIRVVNKAHTCLCHKCPSEK